MRIRSPNFSVTTCESKDDNGGNNDDDNKEYNNISVKVAFYRWKITDTNEVPLPISASKLHLTMDEELNRNVQNCDHTANLNSVHDLNYTEMV